MTVEVCVGHGLHCKTNKQKNPIMSPYCCVMSSVCPETLILTPWTISSSHIRSQAHASLFFCMKARPYLLLLSHTLPTCLEPSSSLVLPTIARQALLVLQEIQMDFLQVSPCCLLVSQGGSDFIRYLLIVMHVLYVMSDFIDNLS